MKIIIADDEPLARQRMRRLLEEVPQTHEICAEAANGVEAIEACQLHHPDVILLDIRMPRLDGLQTAKALSQMPQPPAVLFVTAYDEHALAAFDAQALDYLLKPVRLDRLEAALQKAQRLSAPQTASIGQLLQDTQAVRDTVCAHTPSGLQLIEVDRIRYFMADQKYVEAATDQGQWLLDDPLKDLEQEFAPAFLRVHRNALVALAYVRGLVRDTDGHHQVQLQGVDKQIAVSRRHLPGVRQVLKQSG